jgi:hypothetical protein
MLTTAFLSWALNEAWNCVGKRIVGQVGTATIGQPRVANIRAKIRLWGRYVPLKISSQKSLTQRIIESRILGVFTSLENEQAWFENVREVCREFVHWAFLCYLCWLILRVKWCLYSNFESLDWYSLLCSQSAREGQAEDCQRFDFLLAQLTLALHYWTLKLRCLDGRGTVRKYSMALDKVAHLLKVFQLVFVQWLERQLAAE